MFISDMRKGDYKLPDSVQKIEEIVKWELSEQNRLRETADFQEGIKASLERRDPEFTGN